MKIRVALIDKDIEYMNSIYNNFGKEYAEQLEIKYYSDASLVDAGELKNNADVCLIGHEILDELSLSSDIAKLVLVPDNSIDEILGMKATGKYQSMSGLYNAIYNLHASNCKYVYVNGNSACECVLFTSPVGGIGTTSLAVAYALSNANRGKKVVYLDFNQITSESLYFHGDSDKNWSEVIYAAKAGKNIGMKLKSYLVTDESGVSFFEEASSMLDMMELNEKDVEIIIKEIAKLDDVDLVVVDAPKAYSSNLLSIMNSVDQIVWVSDGSYVANKKIVSYLQTIAKENTNGVSNDTNDKESIKNKSYIFYNKYGIMGKTSVKELEAREYGRVGFIQADSELEVVKQIMKSK